MGFSAQSNKSTMNFLKKNCAQSNLKNICFPPYRMIFFCSNVKFKYELLLWLLLGETRIDIGRIEMSPRYNRPLWKPVNEKQFDVRLSAFGPGTSSERYRTETARTLVEDYGKHGKIYTDGSKMANKVGYAIVKEEHTIMKRTLPQNTVFSAEQSAIIGAIQSEKNSRHELVITMDFLSTIMAAESHTPTKNPKTNY
jgi:hypothetical protein